MEAIVLAAGPGTRLLPLTNTIPKALVPIANRPILDYVLHSIKQAGIRRIVIVAGHLSWRIAEYLRTAGKCDSTEIVFMHAPNYTAGPLYSLLASEKLVDDDFLLTPVDLITKHQMISKLVLSHTQSGTINITVSEFSSQTYWRTCVACFKRPRSGCQSMLQFIDPQTIKESKIPAKTILGISAGAIVCPIEIFKYGHVVAGSGSSRVIDALNRYLADEKEAKCIKVKKADWLDVDTIHALLQANNHVLRDSMVDEENGRFYASNMQSRLKNEASSDYDSAFRVIGPTIVGKRCMIGKNSIIGPYVSIQDDCVIGKHVTCSNTIVLNGSGIKDDSAIENAVVYGQDVVMATKPSRGTSCSD